MTAIRPGLLLAGWAGDRARREGTGQRSPNSKLVVQYTTKKFGQQHGPSTLEPDLPAPRTLADALAGRDRALEAAIAGK